MQIKAIELDNFQVFAKHTRIDFADITLFFGPNSAGKSAVSDAMELASRVLDFSEEKDWVEIEKMASRWARNSSDQSDGEIPKFFLALEYDFDPTSAWGFFEADNWRGIDGNILTDTEWKDLKAGVMRVEMHFVHGLPEIFKASLNDHPVLEVCLNDASYEKDNGYWVKDGELKIYQFGPLGSNLHQACKGTTSVGPYFDQTVTVNNLTYSYALGTHRGVPGEVAILGRLQASKILSDDPSVFAYAWNSLFETLRLPRHESFRNDLTRLIPGNRLLPEQQLSNIAIFKEGAKSSEPWINRLANTACMSKQNKIYQTDKQFLFFDKTTDFGEFCEHMPFHPIDSRPLPEELFGDQFDEINYLLASVLFTNSSYRLDSSLRLIFDVDDDPELNQPTGLVDIFLRDHNGDRVGLDDVGNGIPFCLPWLVAITTDYRPYTIWMHQPELHLHPALQSRVGDALIHGLKFNNGMVVETHSEHLILRLLRRIKQGDKEGNPFPLKHEQLEVYYFDPVAGEGTTVHRLPVTPTGDFYIDWPKGFFRERDEDLFYGE